MEFTLSDITPDISRVVISGRGDAAGIDAVELKFTAALVGAERHIVLDLAAVPFMGSLGIRMLIGTGRVLARRGRKLVICSVQPMVMEVFEAMALSDLIPIRADEKAALDAMDA